MVAVVSGQLLSGCAWFEKKPSPIAGTWKNALGSVWTLRDDGTFEVDLDKDGKRDAWGKYSIDQETISVQSTGGLMPKGCDGKGVYQFTRTGDELQLKLLSDRCKLRKKNLRLPWKLQK